MRAPVAIFAFLGMAVFAAPAQAQATRTWVSGVGDDAFVCSRTAPCKTFAGAISNTAAGGEINCVDPGAFGAVTITKSITIACEQLQAGVLASGSPGIIVNVASTDTVTLRGLDINGGTSGAPGTIGVRMISAGTLNIDKCFIYNFASGTASGVSIETTGATKVTITDTIISRNGTAGAGGGIRIAPTGGPVVNAVLNRVTLANNQAGLTANGASAALLRVQVTDSVITGNAGAGVLATTGVQPTSVFLKRSMISRNATGVQSSGSGAIVLMSDNVITSNDLALSSVGSGALFSYQTNEIDDNGAAGAVPSIVPRS